MEKTRSVEVVLGLSQGPAALWERSRVTRMHPAGHGVSQEGSGRVVGCLWARPSVGSFILGSLSAATGVTGIVVTFLVLVV